MASIYDEELTHKTPEDVTLNGVSFRGLDPAIMSVRLIEDAPETDVQYGQRAEMDGRFVLSARRVRKSLALEFNLRGRFDMAARNQVLDKINAWAAGYGWLTSTTQTAPRVNPQPGAPDDDKEIFVRSAGPVAAGDAWATTQTYRLTFETLGVPYWRDSVAEIGPSTIGSTSYDATFAARGSTPAPVTFTAQARSGSVPWLLAQINPDSTVTRPNLWTGEIEQGTIGGSGTDVDIDNQVRSVGSLALPSGIYEMLFHAASPSIGALNAWVMVYDTAGNYLASESSTAWQTSGFEFALLPGRRVRFVWRRSDAAAMTPEAVASVAIYNRATTSPSSLALVGDFATLAYAFDAEYGFPAMTGTDADGNTISPWSLATEDSDGLLLVPASGGTLHIETGAAAMVTSNWRGWYL